ncbi:zinc finger protein 534-like [Oppia nitens]|uniref:zinc finger protein 534-like n=1 Tax=Oppia nitens TaxID=1686743 RepID=UPI0023DBF041|nr:zinc finger protein 534-like [Oppia nitens]
MTSPKCWTPIVIKVNDIFDELRDEIKRLNNELSFANKLKKHLDKLYQKYGSLIDEEDRHEFQLLQEVITRETLKKSEGIGEDKHAMTTCDHNFSHQSNITTMSTKIITNNSLVNKRSDSICSLNTKQFKTRMMSSTVGKRFVCKESSCGQIFLTKSSLKSHLKLVHSDYNIFKCHYNNCHFSAPQESQLKRHMTESHEDNIALQDKRHKYLQLMSCFNSTTNTYICPEICCRKSCPTYSQFYNHMKYHSDKTTCHHTDCRQVFKDFEQLKQHLLDHQKEMTFKCDYDECHFGCLTQNELICHQTIHKTFVCNYKDCNKVFKNEFNWQRHIRYHETEFKFVCSFVDCNRSFKLNSQLMRHSALHKSEPTLMCGTDGCNKLFFSDNEITRHRSAVHNMKRITLNNIVSCDWPGCDYKSNSYTMKSHKNLHTGEKPYICEWPHCGRQFRLIQNMRDHINVHNNVKPYACSWPECNYRCRCSGNIFKHMKHKHNVTEPRGPGGRKILPID